MENQYYTLIEKQDFYEIIENKFGELAILLTRAKALRLIRCWNLTVKRPLC